MKKTHVYKSNKSKRREIIAKRQQKNSAFPRKDNDIFSAVAWDSDNQLHYTPPYLEFFDAKAESGTQSLNLTDELQQTIDSGYKIFSNYSPPEHFSVCLACCMSVEEELALRTLPLAVLPRELIYCYNTSAKANLTSKNEVTYLLPRILELIACNESIHHSNELNLIWLSHVPKDSLLKEEVDFLEQFSLIYFKNRTEEIQKKEILLSLDEVLIMFCYAGISIEPILAWIAEASNIYLTVSLAKLLAEAKGKDRIFINEFAYDCPEINSIFYTWFERDKNKLKDRANEAILNFEYLLDQPLGYYRVAIEEILCNLSEGKVCLI